jgi:ABC-type phosphate transport system ATPase subunit
MSRVICIAGESGSGKTTSLRNLDPKTTYIIDADRKGLSWKGWKSQYNKESKNYIQTSDVSKINALLQGINDKATHIKAVIIDTINTIMVDDEMARMKEKGFDKWQDMAQSVWQLVSFLCFGGLMGYGLKILVQLRFQIIGAAFILLFELFYLLLVFTDFLFAD